MTQKGKKEGLLGGWQEGPSTAFILPMNKIPFAKYPPGKYDFRPRPGGLTYPY